MTVLAQPRVYGRAGCADRIGCLLGLAATCLLAACASTSQTPQLPEQSMNGVVIGWKNCAFGTCGKGFVSSYSTLTFRRVDDTPVEDVEEVTVPAGRHWFEMRHTWGAAIIMGVGNWNSFGFELDIAPGHRYQIDSLPPGCVVPMSKRHVNRKVLQIAESAPGAKESTHEVNAMEFCAPGDGAGTCRADKDCGPGACVMFDGTMGFGMCSDAD